MAGCCIYANGKLVFLDVQKFFNEGCAKALNAFIIFENC